MTHEPTNTKQDAAAVEATPSPTQVTSNTASITIIEHGPYVVTGDVPLYEDVLVEASDGAYLQYNRLKEYEVGATYRLCRCGASSDKPFAMRAIGILAFKMEAVPLMMRLACAMNRSRIDLSCRIQKEVESYFILNSYCLT